MEFNYKKKYDINDLVNIVEILRSENGCPWDKEQTHKSIRKNLIEETYEVCEAIDDENPDMLKEELGDVLLQVVFHSRMEQEKNAFDFNDVANDICKKLIIRHPHIFSDVSVNSVEDVLNNWNKIKALEKGQKTFTQALESVPRQLPALMRADKVQSRAAKSGYRYESPEQAFADLKSEVLELAQAINEDNPDLIAEELGDVLFSSVNVANRYKLDSEELLTKSCDKFIMRFKLAEQIALDNQIDISTAATDVLADIWKEAKLRIQEG